MAIHILPNISRSEDNQIMKFDQLIEYRLLSKHFFLNLFFPKDSVSLLFAKFKFFLKYRFRLLENTFLTLSDCKSITSTSLMNIFFLRMLWFGDKCTRNCMTQAGPYSTEYQRNENYLCIFNKFGQNNCIRLLADPKAGLKTMLVCYNQTLSRMKMIGLVGVSVTLLLLPLD